MEHKSWVDREIARKLLLYVQRMQEIAFQTELIDDIIPCYFYSASPDSPTFQ